MSAVLFFMCCYGWTEPSLQCAYICIIKPKKVAYVMFKLIPLCQYLISFASSAFDSHWSINAIYNKKFQVASHYMTRWWSSWVMLNGFTEPQWVITFWSRQNGCHFTDDIFKCVFLHENVCILLKISLKFVPKAQINNIPSLVQIMAWHRPGDKPLSEPMMANLLMHICVTQPQ